MSMRTLRRLVVIVFALAGALDAGLVSAQNPPEAVEYYATDALGSVRVVFTPSGQVIGRSAYLPFGETRDQSGSLPRQRFTGQERDGEAGLDYFNARSLQMRTGRMNQPDSLFGNALTSPQRWNRYAYVDNNPLGMTDPSGLSPAGKDGQFFAYDNQTWATDLPGLSPGYSPSDASNHTMGATSWTDLAYEALTPKPLPSTSYVGFGTAVTTEIGTTNVAPTLGIGIEVPASSAVQGGVLNVAMDPGHTFLYLADASGIVSVLSFGPGESIGVTNKSQFLAGNLPGNAAWPLSGNANTWSIAVTPKQLATGVAAIGAFKAQVPNYAPNMQCTSAVLSITAQMGVALPSGVGPVVAREYGVTAWSGNVANPYTLNQQMTATVGPPAVVNTSVFRRR
jgi:RHS repeat-associated protein